MLTNTKNELELIGHLMRRAAFGVRTEELEALASTGYDAVVDDITKMPGARWFKGSTLNFAEST